MIGSMGLGGAEAQLATLIAELQKRGCHCELFVLEAQGVLREHYRASGITVHDGGYDSTRARWWRVLQIARALIRACLVARRRRPDVLHAFLPLTNFLGSIAGRLTAVPLIVTSRRALGTHQDRHLWWRPCDRTAARLSHVVLANCTAVAADAMARDCVAAARLRVIPNGIDAQAYQRAAAHRDDVRRALGLAADHLGVVVVGNLIAYKGHADLLEAVQRVRIGQPRARYFLVGEDRGIGAELRRHAQRIGVEDAVCFLGQRDDVAELMSAMDVFVLPSHEEGFSNALLEAMASGLAVVATDVGGNREALDNGRLGLLVPPHDPDVLGVAIASLLDDGHRRSQLGASAREAVRAKYPVERMVNAHLAVYQEGSCRERGAVAKGTRAPR